MRRISLLLALNVCLCPVPANAAAPAHAASSAAAASPTSEDDALVKELANPLAALISVPFQLNFDDGYADDGSRWTLNIQPVIPFVLNAKCNLLFGRGCLG